MNETKYKINEIFRSVQTEGMNSGKSAIFVRFSGCNLDCKFCDTNHETFVEMTKDEIDKEVEKLSRGNSNVLVVFTGGEPTLQLKENEVIGLNHPKAIETNGIIPAPSWINWVTISPKTKLPLANLKRANEIKVLYSYFDDSYLKELTNLHCHLYLQPLEKCGNMNIKDCVDFQMLNPEWKLSIQWHKFTGVR